MATLTASIAATADDGGVEYGSLYTGSPVLGTNYGDTAARAFWRFTGLAIPAGSTINSATLRFTPNYAEGALASSIRAVNAANPSAFTTAASLTGASLTTAATALTSTAAAWNAGTPISVNVLAQLRAVVALSGWASGNAVAFVAVDTGSTGNGYFEVLNQSATLTVDYTAGGGGTPVTAPATPAGITITPGSDAASVTWTASAGATSYEVEWQGVTAVTMPGVPGGIALTPGPDTVSVTWTKQADSTTYEVEWVTVSADGSVVVRRWNGTAFRTIKTHMWNGTSLVLLKLNR